MTNKELIAELSKRLEWTQAQTSKIMEDAVSVINTNLANSDSINIQGFGLFETKRRQERMSVNPVSKQRFLVPPKITPAFRPGQVVKDKLKKLSENE
ncbi:HU family DNA-binding protein [Dysgonomonas sp. HDW5A]|uniref:HU family DNA-binding protein n=1 Tax=unclassified Dysgonomonas TaxID=2630389 RepID=UPI001409D7AA|nr:MULTISPECIES: HU family DNA-binding protein [unclassified Dysgonomonas]QIK53362.1 HU family DNA-binding protein [Dysgonomonas sp. HDW5B]QIK58851.1 HU family DNA-binding protein [Dysgonomonas sp. HDW5A]